MKSQFARVGSLAILAVCLFVLPIYAQTTEATTRSIVPSWYDITKEVTVTGTVSSLVKQTTPEMKMLGGFHLIVETTSGRVDASLGKLAVRGGGTLSVTPGERVQVTGVIKTVRGQQVLLSRILQVNGHVYKIRNEHGYAIAVSRQDSANTWAKSGQQ